MAGYPWATGETLLAADLNAAIAAASSSVAAGGPFLSLSGVPALFASPPAMGGTAAAAGSFTTLSASSTVSGAGFSAWLASPPAIGGTLAAAGTFTSLTATGAQSLPLPAAKTGTSYSVATTDCSLVLNPSGTFTLTLPAASSSPGRIIRLKLIAAFAVNSASSNIVQLTGTTSAAIMPATSGKFCLLQSDATSWQIMQAN